MDREENERSVTRLQRAIRLDALWEMPQMTRRDSILSGPTWLPFMEGAMELLPGIPRISLTILIGLAISTRCRVRRKYIVCTHVVGNTVVHRMKEVWLAQEVEVKVFYYQCGSDLPMYFRLPPTCN